ncbi:hypothetical protein [Actinacidiphila sp. ITFR-21]|uniref:hypothetical protein n=1 Tax=Actinacidiphila sp. ITFR-21 TaxID=3075199 RepID=UPI00288BCD0C|nr:hypothetical protein [Streptomyces sp. ITFR-21]WNI15913.1 hypothetical protein RLT57_10540 [Streptomyces sp. ITFR-21]
MHVDQATGASLLYVHRGGCARYVRHHQETPVPSNGDDFDQQLAALGAAALAAGQHTAGTDEREAAEEPVNQAADSIALPD